MLTFVSILLDCEKLTPEIADYEDGDAMGPCGWMMQGRLWMPQTVCALEEKVDYSSYYRFHFNDKVKIGDNKDCSGLADVELEDCENYNDNAQIDLSYVHVASLGAVNYDAQRVYFSIMEIREGAEFANAVLNITATIDLAHAEYSQAKEIYVSPFQSVDGSVKNVSIFGTISIINYESDISRKLFLSNMFGDMGDTAEFSDLSSGLKFVVDGQDYESGYDGVVLNCFPDPEQIEEERCEPIIANPDGPGASEEEESELLALGATEEEEETTPSAPREIHLKRLANMAALVVLPYTMPTACEDMGEVCFTTEVKIYNRLKSQTEDLNVTTLFDRRLHPNVFTDFYTGQVARYFEFMVETANLTRRPIPSDEEITDTPANLWLMNSTSDQFILYTGETKTVIWKRGQYIRICDGAMLYDMQEDACIKPSFTFNSCPRGARFLAMCVQICPRDYIGKGEMWYETNMSSKEVVCYPECPKWLGWTDIPAEIQDFYDDTCVKCPNVDEDAVTAAADAEGGEAAPSDIRDKYKMLLASDTSCAAQCSDRQYMLGKGCYPSRPAGTICIAEKQASQDEEEKPVVQNFCEFPKPFGETYECPPEQFLAFLSINVKLYSAQYYPTCRLFTPAGFQPYSTAELFGGSDSNNNGSTIFLDGCRNSITGEQQIDITGKCSFLKLTNDTCEQPINSTTSAQNETPGQSDQSQEDVVAMGAPRWLRGTSEEEEEEEENADNPYADQIIMVFGPKEQSQTLSRCRAGCINSTVDASGLCSCGCGSGYTLEELKAELCKCGLSDEKLLELKNNYTYPQPKFGRCNPCKSSYDGGAYFNFKEQRCTRKAFCDVENCMIHCDETDIPETNDTPVACDPDTECCACKQSTGLSVYNITNGVVRTCTATPCKYGTYEEDADTLPNTFKNCKACKPEPQECPCVESGKTFVNRVTVAGVETAECVDICTGGKVPKNMSTSSPIEGYEGCQECVEAPPCHCPNGRQFLEISNGVEECVETCSYGSIDSKAYPGCKECLPNVKCDVCESGIYKLSAIQDESGNSITNAYFEYCVCDCMGKVKSPVYPGCMYCPPMEIKRPCLCLTKGTKFMEFGPNGEPSCMAADTKCDAIDQQEIALTDGYEGCSTCVKACPICEETGGAYTLIDPTNPDPTNNHVCGVCSIGSTNSTFKYYEYCQVCNEPEQCKCTSGYLKMRTDGTTSPITGEPYDCIEHCESDETEKECEEYEGCKRCVPIPPVCQKCVGGIYDTYTINVAQDGTITTPCIEKCPTNDSVPDKENVGCNICTLHDEMCDAQIFYPDTPGDLSSGRVDVDCISKVLAGTHIVVAHDGVMVCEPRCRLDQNVCMLKQADGTCVPCESTEGCNFVEEVTKACKGKTFTYYKCIEKCFSYVTNGMISYDKTNPEMSYSYFHQQCVQRCPDEYKYSMSDKTCTKCEGGYIVTSDINGTKTSTTQECTLDCTKVTFRDPSKSSLAYCLDSCPNGWFVYGTICVGSCPDGMVVVSGVCTGQNKTAMWIYIVIGLSIAFLIVVTIILLLMMKKKRVGIQRIKRRQEHSGKTVYYSNKIKQNLAGARQTQKAPLLDTATAARAAKPKTRVERK